MVYIERKWALDKAYFLVQNKNRFNLTKRLKLIAWSGFDILVLMLEFIDVLLSFLVSLWKIVIMHIVTWYKLMKYFNYFSVVYNNLKKQTPSNKKKNIMHKTYSFSLNFQKNKTTSSSTTTLNAPSKSRSSGGSGRGGRSSQKKSNTMGGMDKAEFSVLAAIQ